MMGRNILFFLSLSVILSSCSRNFTVEAEIGSEDYDGVTVYMIRKHPVEYSENTVLDSTVISGGRYGFTYRISEEPFIAIFKIHVLFIDHQTYISEILKNIVYFGVSR